MNNTYICKKINKKINGVVTVPGSKSMTNRALLLAAMAKGSQKLRGVLFSDDSRHFLDSLISLGYRLSINESDKIVEIEGTGGNIPNKTGTIDVGSAGTAARFLTAMLALSDGEYTVNCSEQMEKRPMDELFKVLSEMGAEFTYLKEDKHLPVIVKGNGGRCKDINMDISKSTQYLSAMLMVTPVTNSGITITITSDKKTGSYIGITRDMLKHFGVTTEFDGEKYYVAGNQEISVGDYYIEPDVSAACYFYGLAALTGGKIRVNNVFSNSTQGDLKFLQVLKQMGCEITEEQEGIAVTGPDSLMSVDVNMNDFSDQALTLAAIAPYAKGTTVIRNVGHIRGQECNRMAAIVNELTACGISCEEKGDDIYICEGKPQKATIETYNDHRVAMSFTLFGLMTEGIVIKDPMCCRKTFENYYEVLEKIIKENE